MRARTEDLLTIRDGEPIDAALHERLAADPDNAREIARLTRVAEDLRCLPVLEPPPEIWQRVTAEADPGRGRGLRLTGWASAAIAAGAIAAAATVLIVAVGPPDTSTGDARVAGTPPAAPVEHGQDRQLGVNLDDALGADVEEAGGVGVNEVSGVGVNEVLGLDLDDALDAGTDDVPGAQRDAEGGVDYARLVAESERLERLLAELGRGPRLMSAATASTIADLEDRIVLLDDQLTYAEARDAEPRYRQALWRERVDVMNALVYVRYAQAGQVPDVSETF